MESDHSRQKHARGQLVVWASIARNGGSSMQKWLDDQEVLNYCNDFKLDTNVLEHIAQWVWRPIKR